MKHNFLNIYYCWWNYEIFTTVDEIMNFLIICQESKIKEIRNKACTMA